MKQDEASAGHSFGAEAAPVHVAFKVAVSTENNHSRPYPDCLCCYCICSHSGTYTLCTNTASQTHSVHKIACNCVQVEYLLGRRPFKLYFFVPNEVVMKAQTGVFSHQQIHTKWQKNVFLWPFWKFFFEKTGNYFYCDTVLSRSCQH